MKNLSLATLFAAVSGFVVLWVASKALDAETGYRYFAAYWGLFFASTGLIDGITHETTRSVAAAREDGRHGSANPWKMAAWLALGALVVALVLGFLLVDSAIGTGLLQLGLVFYVFQAVLSGVLSGAQLWDRYAALVALDSGVRLVLALAAWALGWGLPAFLVITVIGAFCWLMVLRREHIRMPLDVDRGEFVRRVVTAMVASGSSAALITGFPTAVNAAFPEASVAAVINAVILTRAPVLVPLQRFQSALVVRFVEHREAIYGALVKPVVAVLALGAVGFVAAWAVGPWVLRLAFDPEFYLGGLALGTLTFASAFMGALMITGVAVLSLEKHRWYVAGWVVATLTAFTVLFTVPAQPLEAVVAALFVGPLAGAAVHLMALRLR